MKKIKKIINIWVDKTISAFFLVCLIFAGNWQTRIIGIVGTIIMIYFDYKQLRGDSNDI